jgi:aryl-alcohol dehydrogenase-like predicted oxidoreductase
VWDKKGNVHTNLSPDSIRKEAEQSLQRLHTDYIDLYQIHWPDWGTPVEDSWNEMTKLRHEGKVRYIGVCNFGLDLLQRCQTIADVQSLQPIYNVLERDIEHEILPYCSSHGIGVVAYSPMQSGLLSGSFDLTKLAPDDWRHNSEKFKEPKSSRGMHVVERLRPIAQKYRKTVGQLAIAWVLANGAVTSAIVGARTPQQVKQNTGGAGWSIGTADIREIDWILTS